MLRPELQITTMAEKAEKGRYQGLPFTQRVTRVRHSTTHKMHNCMRKYAELTVSL